MKKTTAASTRIQDQESQTESVASAMDDMRSMTENISVSANTDSSAALLSNTKAQRGKIVVDPSPWPYSMKKFYQREKPTFISGLLFK